MSYHEKVSDSTHSNPFTGSGYSDHPGNGRPYEMTNFSDTSSPNDEPIIDRCQRVNQQIGQLEYRLKDLMVRHQDAKISRNERDQERVASESTLLSNDTGKVIDQIAAIKKTPGAGEPYNLPQVNRMASLAEQFLHTFNENQNIIRTDIEEQSASAIMITDPTLSFEEALDHVRKNPASEGHFAQALRQNGRADQARAAQDAATARAAIMREIARTYEAIHDMHSKLEQLAIVQEERIQRVDEQTANVKHDVEGGQEQVVQTKESALGINRKKRWCLVVSLIIIALIIIFVLLGVLVWGKPGSGGGNNNNDNNNNNNNSS